MIKNTTKIIAGLFFSTLISTASYAKDNYITYKNPFPSNSQDKVEVLEFFSYGCSHCAAIEPLVDEWVQTFDDDVAFVQVPVAFNSSMEPMQKAYYTLVAMDKKDLHSKMFDAIHKEKKRLFERQDILDWFVEQGLDKDEVTATFDSFGVQTKAKNARELTDRYNVEGTPSIAVGGQYLTSPGMVGSYEGAIDQAQQLLDKILDQ